MSFEMSSCCDVDDEIFYSDEEEEEQDIFKTSRISDYFSAKSESIFTSRLRQDSVSPDNAYSFSSPIYIDNPINQISSGIGSLLREEVNQQKSSNKTMSYSAMMKKAPLANNTQINNVKVAKSNVFSVASKKPTAKVNESALAAGYRFKAKDPTPDPRYPGDQQLMIGPIPGHIEHDTIYNNLRSIFQSRGPVCFMFVHKSAVKDAESGNPVKFGYVVFAEKGAAQKVLKEGHVTFGGGFKIKVKPMKGSS